MTKDSVSYTDAVDILMPTLGIPASRRASFESRLRHVQLVQARTGRAGKRIRYDVDEIALLAFAFMLMGAHLPPRLAIRHVVERRIETLRLLRDAAGRADGTILITGNGLDAIGEGGQDEDIPLEPAKWSGDAGTTTRTGIAILVDAGRMMSSLSPRFEQAVAHNTAALEERQQRRIENNRASSRRYNAAKAAARTAATKPGSLSSNS